ncbi:GntR family transcriptional regulator [Pseudonocardia kunmingensis]|uniref:GntR family transcriptional regulator n=1 Tax=Pseudonocardia kunmingensis TaxID=630975 RepID=UPI00114DA893|nr:GntR family transcriptional regulator [Pseudonocardia kunmingensis]
MARPTSRTNRRTVYETLRREVLTLELPPGAALSENELAARLGVSRTPVRESLILLAEEGLVQVFPQVGSFVSRVDPARVADAQFLREAVELASLEDLPAHLDPDLVRELRENLSAQRRPDLDVEEFFVLDEAFHHALLRLSGHGNAWTTVVAAKGHLDRARRLGLQATAPPAFTDQHVEILDAVLAGDVVAARTAMRAHLRAVFDDVEQIRERAPELFARDPASAPVRRNVVVWE